MIEIEKISADEYRALADGRKIGDLTRVWGFGKPYWVFSGKVGGTYLQVQSKTRKAAIDWVGEHGHKLDRVEFKV